jgi:hypothetical protein
MTARKGKGEVVRVGRLVTRDALYAALTPLTTFRTEVTTYVVKRATTLEEVQCADADVTAETVKRASKLF